MDRNKYEIVNKEKQRIDVTSETKPVEEYKVEALERKSTGRGKGINFFIIVAIVLALSFICGDLFFKFVVKDVISGDKIKNIDEQKQDIKEESVQGIVNESHTEVNSSIGADNVKSYYAIQCGVFKEKSNANDLYEKLKQHGTPFIYKEDMYRVYFGIYEEEASVSVSKFLEGKGFQIARVIFNTPNDTNDEIALNEMIMALLKINWKIENEGLKEFESKSLKEWCAQINIENYSGEKLNDIKLLINEIKSFPESISKEKCEYIYLKLFEILSKG